MLELKLRPPNRHADLKAGAPWATHNKAQGNPPFAQNKKMGTCKSQRKADPSLHPNTRKIGARRGPRVIRPHEGMRANFLGMTAVCRHLRRLAGARQLAAGGAFRGAGKCGKCGSRANGCSGCQSASPPGKFTQQKTCRPEMALSPAS